MKKILFATLFLSILLVSSAYAKKKDLENGENKPFLGSLSLLL